MTNIVQEELTKLLAHIEGAYAPNTIRAFKADFEEFMAFCEANFESALPSNPQTVARFVEMVTKKGLASATIRRKLVSIGSVHRLSELPDPTKAGCVALAVRKMHRQLGRANHQAHPINKDTLEKMLEVCSDGNPLRRLQGLRNRVLLLMAYDTMARRSELVSLRFEDVDSGHQSESNNAGIYLRRSKVDQEAKGRWLPITQSTLEAIQAWSAAISDDRGPILRSVRGNAVGKTLGCGQVGRILKRLAKEAKMPEDLAQRVSGHSLRVGAAQDWTIKGLSLPQLMVMGGWEKSDTVIRYIGKSRIRIEGITLSASTFTPAAISTRASSI
jgi:site-specific recombinase XerD